MKKILIAFLFFLNLGIFAQNDAAKIQKDFESLVAFTQKKQMDKVIGMTYPPFVSLFGEEGLTQMLNGMLEGMGIQSVFEEVPLNLKMSSFTTIKNGAICMGAYDNSMILEFKDEAMVNMFTMVKLDGTTIEKIDSKKIRMKGRAFLLALKDSNTNGTWKYLNYTDELAAMPQATEVVTQEIITESAKLKTSLLK